MDFVYLVRPGDANEELRYSLRSLTNVPHDAVWIAGHKPPWVTGVQHIPTVQDSYKNANAFGNLLAALNHPDISADFVLMNDDFFITSPLPGIPTLHRGPLADVVTEYRRKYPRGSGYITAMADTLRWLQSRGIEEPLSYGLHVPMVFNRDKLLEVIGWAEDDGVDVTRFHTRSAYGNLAGVGGERIDDCKIYTRHRAQLTTPFMSTKDASFTQGVAGTLLRRHFPDPGRYEDGKATMHRMQGTRRYQPV